MCAARPGARWRIVVAQVRRKFMMARWLQSRCDVSPNGPSEWRLCSGHGLPTRNVYHIVIGGCAPEYKKRATFRPSACAPLLGLEPRTP